MSKVRRVSRGTGFMVACAALAVAPALRADGPAPVEAGVAKGRVTTADGRPLAGAVINLENTMFVSQADVRVGKDGTYRRDLTIGSWRVRGHVLRKYNGQPYTFDLCPDDPDDIDGTTGGVKNFTWKLSGDRPEGELGTYGSPVVAYAEPGDFSFQTTDVELTLTPDGPLVDGSQGRVITGKLVHTPDGDAIKDVPVGRYKVMARLVPADGPAADLRVRVRNKGQYGPTVTADFENPIAPDMAIHRIELEVKKP